MRERLPSGVFELPVEKMRDGYSSDAYFVYTKATLERERHHPNVVMQVFPAVRIVVSGGFSADKIRAFEAARVPVDAYGVGSSLIRGENDFTADIVRCDGVPAAKAGRSELPNPRLEPV
jgi:nicotinic acid phosphoribosyltransferase